MQEVPDVIEQQLRKLRRRLEEHFRHSSPEVLIKYATERGIPVPKLLSEFYGDRSSRE